MKQEHTKKKQNRTLVAGMVAVIAILISLLLLLHSCHANTTLPDPPSPSSPVFDLVEDYGAKEGTISGTPTEEIEEDLNEKVHAGMMNISMNSNPIFDAETLEGNVLITNAEENQNPQVVEIYRNDTEELVYRSGLIPVGTNVETGTLKTSLPVGTYGCTAMFHAVNGESGAVLGKAGADIAVTVS